MTLLSKNLASFPYVFGREFDRAFQAQQYHTLPAVNVTENEQGYQLELAAPGLKKEDFKISINQNRLTISVQQESSDTENAPRYLRKEFSFQSFQRVFHLPKTVEDAQIEATYQEGILTLVLPKKAEAQPKPIREIAIG
jgi:HSP20 family protein